MLFVKVFLDVYFYVCIYGDDDGSWGKEEMSFLYGAGSKLHQSVSVSKNVMLSRPALFQGKRLELMRD